MPLGNNEVNTNPGGSSLTVASHDVNYRGQVDGQNLYGQHSPQTGGRSLTIPSYYVNYRGQVDGQNLYGQQSPQIELNTEHGRVNYHPMNPQAVSRPREESFSIDFS